MYQFLGVFCHLHITKFIWLYIFSILHINVLFLINDVKFSAYIYCVVSILLSAKVHCLSYIQTMKKNKFRAAIR